jgi:PAS domain S-box-containing protein
MPEREKAGRKAIEKVQQLCARVAKLERIALRKAGPKDADRELDRAWSEWETTFDAIGDSVILLDSEFNILQANAATSSLLGKPLDEIVGQRCCKLVHGSNKPLEDCPLIKTKTTKTRQKAELCIAEKGIWALVSVDPILDEQGNLTGAVHIIRDITDRKKAEEEIGRLAKFPAENPHPVLRITKEGEILYSNEAGKLLLMHWNSKVGKTVPEKWRSLITEAFGSKKTKTEEEKVEDRIFSCVIAPVKDAGYVNLYGRDVTEHKRAEEALAQSEQKYKELFESAREAIIIMDLNGKIADANRAVEEYGHTRDYLLGKSIFDFIPVNHRARAAKDFDELCHGTPVKGEMEVVTPKGNFTVEYNDSPIVRKGQIVAVQAILTDITERKTVTERLIRLSRILKMIAQVNQDMFLIRDRNQLLESVCSRIVGHPYKMVWIGFCDEPTKTVVPAAQAGFEEGYLDSMKVTYDDSEYGRGPTGTAIRTNKPCVVRSTAKDPTYQPWRKEALKRGYRSSAAIPIVSGERAIGALNVYSEKEDAFGDEEISLLEELAHDISTGLRAIDEEDKRKQAKKRLQTYQAELKSLASELSLTEERERRRIAEGIHDGIGQKLALAKMELQLLARPPGNSRIPASLDGVCARIDEAIKDAHSLTFELSNPALYDLRFAAAIDQWLLKQIQKKHGIKCTVIADEQAVPLDEDSKVVLFRALRELAVNVVKHAKATALTVTIEKLENSVQITCKDDGFGFTPPEEGALPRDVGGFGLFNIKERLEHLGGGMKLQSAPGRGTLITLSLPLERQNDAGADEGRQ